MADRENRRIQCFDLEGNFLRQIHAPEIVGKVYAVSFDPVAGQYRLSVCVVVVVVVVGGGGGGGGGVIQTKEWSDWWILVEAAVLVWM